MQSKLSLLQLKREQARLLPTRRDGTMRKRVAFGTDRAAELNPLLSLTEDWMQAPGGYGPHLHQGFETVTLVLEGQLWCFEGEEEQQAQGRMLGPGGVQWLTAGSGVVHAELPSGEGEAHMISLWLNLPAAQKLVPPQALSFSDNEIPEVAKRGARVRVISGEFQALRGPAQGGSQARVLEVRLDQGTTLDLPIPPGQVGFAYVLEGTLQVGLHQSLAGDVLHFSNQAEFELALVASTSVHLFLVNAPPLREPVVVNGPFVMNTAHQVQQAYAAFRAGAFAGPSREP